MQACKFRCLLGAFVLARGGRSPVWSSRGSATVCIDEPSLAAEGGYPNSLTGASAAAADEGKVKVTLIFCVIQPYFCMPPIACSYCIRTDKYYMTDGSARPTAALGVSECAIPMRR